MPKAEKLSQPPGNMTIMSAKFDKLTENMEALMEVHQNRTAQQISKFQQNTDVNFTKLTGFMGEIKSQVSQHSAEITSLKENLAQVTEELHDLKASVALGEGSGTTGAATANGTSSNSGDKATDLHELSMQLEKRREQIICFPAKATAREQKQVINRLLRKPVMAEKWNDKYNRQHILLRFNCSQDAKHAFKGLYDELRAQNITVYDSLTPKQREHERNISAKVAQLYRNDPRMNARYSGMRVTVFEVKNRSSRMVIDTSAFTTETLPTSLRDPRLQTQMHAAMAARRARPAPVQQPIRPAAPAAPAAPAPASAPAAPRPAAPPPAPATSAAASTPAAQTTAPARAPRAAPQPAEHTSTLLDTLLESEKSYGESDSEEEALVSRRAPARTRQQTRQQTRHSATQPTQRAQQKKADKRTAPASTATATKPAHKQPRHTGLPLANQFSVFDDILREGDQTGPSSAGAPDPSKARMDPSGDGQAA